MTMRTEDEVRKKYYNALRKCAEADFCALHTLTPLANETELGYARLWLAESKVLAWVLGITPVEYKLRAR